MSNVENFKGLPYVTEELNAPAIATTLTAALFVLFMGIAPVVWAAISEHYHIRRFLFLVAMVIFMATSIGAAFVHNIWALVGVRCIQSMGVSSAQSVGAGYISDLYPIEERGAAFGKYMFGVICGPLLGPILGGFLIMSPLGWRATFWFCFIFGIFIFIITFFFTPETYRDDAKFDAQLPVTAINSVDEKVEFSHSSPRSSFGGEVASQCSDSTVIDEPVNSSSVHIEEVVSIEMLVNEQDKDLDKYIDSPNKVENDKSKQNDAVILIQSNIESKKKPFNPFAPFKLLRHPFVSLSSITAGFFFGAMFATEAILPEAFKQTYGLNSWQTGLCYLGAGVGNLSGALVGGKLSDRLLMRSRRLRGGQAKAEDRLTANIWIAGFLFNPLGLIIFGWVVQYKLSYWGAIVGFGIQCFGNVQVMTTVTAYLVDSMPGRGAAATAAANFVRFGSACVLTLISTPMVETLGAGWTATLFAGLSCIGMFILILLKMRGEEIRKFSGY